MDMNPTQQEIYNNIYSFDFTYFEKFKRDLRKERKKESV